MNVFDIKLDFRRAKPEPVYEGRAYNPPVPSYKSTASWGPFDSIEPALGPVLGPILGPLFGE